MVQAGFGKKLIDCLRWRLDWGNNVEFLEKRKAAGKAAPALDKIPELYEDLEIIWRMFWKLNKGRQVGISINPITEQSIEIVFNWFCIPYKYRNEYSDYIRAMDTELMNWRISKDK